MTEQNQTVSPEHEYLGAGKSLAYGLQHVLTMYGGIIAPPLIIGTAAGLEPAQIGLLIAAALFVGGLATILQTVGVKYIGAKLPLVQGVSFAGVATMIAIVTAGGGLSAVYGAVIVASLIGFFLARYFSMEKGLFDYQKQSHLKLLVCGHTVQTIFLKTEIFSG